MANFTVSLEKPFLRGVLVIYPRAGFLEDSPVSPSRLWGG